MGGSSKKQTVGYKIYVDQQLVVCAGPIDGIRRFTWDGKEAWRGWSTGGRVAIDKPKLFGGEKREGGVAGDIDFCPGGPEQMPNDYLVSKLGALVNAARGAATLVLRGLYVGLNPYLKRPAVRAQRIHVRQQEGLAQWYDVKAAIPAPGPGDLGRWQLVTDGPPVQDNGGPLLYEFAHGVVPASAATPETFDSYAAALARIRELYGAEMQCVGFFSSAQPALDLFGDAITGYQAAFSSLETCPDYIYLCFASEQPAEVIWMGLDEYTGSFLCTPIAEAGHAGGYGGPWLASNITRNYPSGEETNDQLGLERTGPNTFGGYQQGHGGLVRTVNGALPIPAHYSDGGLGNTVNNCIWGGGLGTSTAVLQPFKTVRVSRQAMSGMDMNPAHILREAWTDPRMSMGLPEVDVDDEALTVAADRLYDEGFGLSVVWSEEQTIGDFIDDICRHIDAEWYVDRRTGKLVLKLIRDDYDPDALLVLDRSNTGPVENLSQPLPGELVNSITVQFWNEAAVKDGVVSVSNDALVQMQGGVNGKTVKYAAITNRPLASRVALRELRACSIPLRSCTVHANRQASRLNKGDPFKLHRPELGLTNVVMRVVDIDFGDGRDNRVTISCIEDAFQMPPLPIVSVGGSEGQNPVQAPAASPARLVIEAPYLELVRRAGQTQADTELAAFPEVGYLMVAAQRPSGDALHAGLAVDAGGGYTETATIDFAPVATLSAAAGRLDAVLAITGGVDLDDVEAGSLAQVGGELLRVDGVDAAAGTVNVGRGCLDTVPVPHAAGELIFFLDSAADGDEVQHAAGDVLFVKVLPETGQGQLDISAAPADSITLAGRAIRPYPPGDVKFNGAHFPEALDSSANIVLTWASRNRQQQTSGVLLDFLDSSVTSEPGVTYTVRGLDASNLTSVVYNAPGITTLTHTIPAGSLNTVARVRLQVLSERDGLESWQAHELEFDTSVAFWTPANLTTPPTLWVSDDSAITEESGGVSQINDLSANGYHLSQSTSSARPTAVAGGLNGRRVLRFGGDDRVHSTDAGSQNVLSGAGEAWSIAVIKSSSAESGNRYYFGITESTSSANTHYLAVLSSTNGGTYTNRPGIGGRRVVGTSYSEIRSATTVGTDWHMALKRLKYASATGVVNVDGAADESAAMTNMTAGVAPTRTWGRLSLGHHSSTGSSFLIGDIAEFVFGVGTLTNDERDKLFGYLAHKWALQSRLPSDHPYKTSPPTL